MARAGFGAAWRPGAVAVALAMLAAHPLGAQEHDPEESPARSFLYKEAVLSGFYSSGGVKDVPPGDTTEDHFEISPRPPGNYVGLEYVQTIAPRSWLNQAVLPGELPASALNLHPRLVFDRMEGRGGFHRIKFAPQDFWIRLNPGNKDRLTLRAGQFVIPYGVNPIMAPRQRFLLPLEGTDLGLKWDWGLGLKGPLDEYDWELAATIGSGEALYSHHFSDGDRASYLFSGRVGSPTYWDLQYGASFLLGDLATIRGPKMVDSRAISRWRFGLDGLYKYGTYLMLGAQTTFGQDGFAGDEPCGHAPADVFGGLGWLEWVVPVHRDLRLAAQFESLIRDVGTSDSDETAAVFEAGYSVFTTVSLMLDYRLELNRAMGDDDDAVFLTFVYYGS